MKRYIILTSSIAGVGGGQIYSKNKKKFLEDHGWHVDIFSFGKGTILISELSFDKNNVIRELKQSPKLFTNSQRENIIKLISREGEYQETIIESHTINLAIWGEFIAERIGGKHFIFLLTESFSDLNKSKLDFLSFKHKRKELVGITEKSLELLFKGYKHVETEKKFAFKPICTNVVEDVENDIVKSIERRDINIGCITRLDKAYIKPLLEEVIKFARLNSDKTIQLVFIGGTHNKFITNTINKRVEHISNLNVIITGFLYPIPKHIFKIIDFFICTAGSAKVSAREGVMTLAVDCQSVKPIGIIGYDTNKTLYANENCIASLSEKLNEILIEKKLYRDKSFKYDKISEIELDIEFKKQMNFIYASEPEKTYYNFQKIRPTNKEILKRALNLIPSTYLEGKITYWNSRFKSLAR